jgi:hypothetical protein
VELGHGRILTADLQVEHTDMRETLTEVPCGGQGTKDFQPVYNRVRNGLATPDTRTLDVAAGKGAQIGTNFAAGFLSPDDSFIVSIEDSGNCSNKFSVYNNGLVTGIAINTSGLYYVATVNGNKDAVVFYNDHINSELNFARSFKIKDPNGYIQFSGIAVSPNGSQPEVAIAGTIKDSTLGLNYQVSLQLILGTNEYFRIESQTVTDFGVPSGNDSVAFDRAGNTYWGGRITDPLIGDAPLTFRMNKDYATIPWAYAWDYDGTFNNDPRVGIRGTRYVGGTGDQNGVYFVGTQGWQSTLGTAPGAGNMLALKLNPQNGSFTDPDDYAYLFYSTGLGDLLGTDVAVDREGNAYQSANRSTAADLADHAGRVYRFDLATQTTSFQQNYGFENNGQNELINGIDLRTSDPDSDIFYGGLIQGDPVSPPLNLGGGGGFCSSFISGDDAFIARSAQVA